MPEVFAIGDTVWLKAGGPAMAIAAPHAAGWRCHWASNLGAMVAIFEEPILTHTNPNPDAPFVMHVGNGPPLDTVGENGDAYTDLLMGNIYQKQNDTWF